MLNRCRLRVGENKKTLERLVMNSDIKERSSAPLDVIDRRLSLVRLPQDTAESVIDLLDELMVTEKYFLNPKLRQQMLADALGVNVYQLSEAINCICGFGFYQYVNKYRIGYAKEIIESAKPGITSVEVLYHKCGFNNRTSFYNAFKKIVGMTPAKYLYFTNRR